MSAADFQRTFGPLSGRGCLQISFRSVSIRVHLWPFGCPIPPTASKCQDVGVTGLGAVFVSARRISRKTLIGDWVESILSTNAGP